jgi:ABC-2 type transport system ATP-binding protein
MVVIRSVDQAGEVRSDAAVPAIEFEGLTKRFGTFVAVDRLSFAVPRGAVFGFLGPNGAGKTTTLGMLLGLVPIDGGTARIFGDDVQQHLAGALQRTGALVERPAFYPYLSGRQNLRLFARIAGIADDAAIEKALETVDLTRRADAKFGGYSTGMKQRLGVAAALIKQPDLVVLDEPTSGLDPAGQREIRALIGAIAAGGRTVILSSHLLHEVQEICTHVAIIDRGRLVTTGPLAQILAAREEVVIRTDRPQEAVAVVRVLPEVRSVEVAEDVLIAEMPVARAGSVNRALVTAGFEVTELRPRQRALEERFLALTEGAEEGAPHGAD